VAEAVLDANVLVRFLTEDPPAMVERADEILHAAEEHEVALVVAPLTLAEVVFVLESVYGWKRREIAVGLVGLLAADVLEVLEDTTVRQALEWYERMPSVHFADAYACAVAVGRGHGAVVSFDHALRRVPGVRRIERARDIVDITRPA